MGSQPRDDQARLGRTAGTEWHSEGARRLGKAGNGGPWLNTAIASRGPSVEGRKPPPSSGPLGRGFVSVSGQEAEGRSQPFRKERCHRQHPGQNFKKFSPFWESFKRPWSTHHLGDCKTPFHGGHVVRFQGEFTETQEVHLFFKGGFCHRNIELWTVLTSYSTVPLLPD